MPLAANVSILRDQGADTVPKEEQTGGLVMNLREPVNPSALLVFG